MKKKFLQNSTDLGLKLRFGISQTGFRIFTQLIIVIYLGKELTIQETITWGGLSTLSALVMMLEFGFNSTLSRNYNYILNGSQRILADSIDKTIGNVNTKLLSDLRVSTKYYYAFITIIFFIISFIFFSQFLPIKDLQNNEKIACAVHITYLTVLISSFNEETIITGMDKIEQQKKNLLIGAILGFTSFVLFLSFDQLLIGFSANQLIAILTTKILNRQFVLKELGEESKGSFDFNLLKSLIPNTIKLGITGLMGFTLSKMYYFIGSRKLIQEDFSMLIIVFTIFGVIESFASLYGQLLYAKMLNYLKQERLIQLKKNIQAAQISQIIVFIISPTILYLIIPLLIPFRRELDLLSLNFLLLITLYRYIENNIGLNGLILTLENKIPFFKSAMYSGIVSLFLYLAMFVLDKINIYTIILIPLLTQLIFQFFKWNWIIYVKYIKSC